MHESFPIWTSAVCIVRFLCPRGNEFPISEISGIPMANSTEPACLEMICADFLAGAKLEEQEASLNYWTP
jgi:hypothetical protein